MPVNENSRKFTRTNHTKRRRKKRLEQTPDMVRFERMRKVSYDREVRDATREVWE